MKRLLFYSYGAFGLGHLRRCLSLANGLACRNEPISVLVATNSAQAGLLEAPEYVHFLQLPPLVRDIFDKQANKYSSLTAGLSPREAFRKRSQMLRSALRDFRPQLIFIDHGPTGAEREAVGLLSEAADLPANRRPGLVLGLRDIYGELDWTNSDWARLGAWEVLPLYDLMLVLGDETITTTAQELNLPNRFPGRVHHAGYVAPSTASEGTRGEQKSGPPLLLVTAGGGYDGGPLFESFVNFLQHSGQVGSLDTHIVTGPFFPPQRLADLRRRVRAAAPAVEVTHCMKRMASLLSRATGVITMGGYNTLVEIVSRGVPALVFPRRTPSEEQILRARRLGPRGGFSVCPPDEPAFPAISTFLERLTHGCPEPSGPPVDLNGVKRSAELLQELV